MELHDYLRVLRRRWIVVLGCLVLAVALVGFITLRTTPLYTSTARLFVTAPQSDSNIAGAYQGGLFTQQRVKSYADIVRSNELAGKVIDRVDVDIDADNLTRQVSARVIPDTVLLDISVTDPSPEDAQVLAQAYAAEFTAVVAELEQPPGGGDPVVKVTTIDKPDLPTRPVSPQPLRNIGLAAVLGLLVGIGLAVLRDLLDTSIKDMEQLGEIAGAPSLGIIGFDSSATDRPLVVHLDPHSPRAEAFRQLRTNLQFVDVDKQTKVIVITSSVPVEGKTTTTVNLAITLAEAGQRVVLVEGDLRRPRVAEYLGLVGSVGVTTVLGGRSDVGDVIQPWDKEAMLQVVASGPIPPNPSELLQSHAMSELLKTLQSHADIILIDAPPLLPVADAAILSAAADGAILVVRHGSTTREQVERAVQNLEQVGSRLLGTVVNMAPAKGPDAYLYGYGYSYARKDAAAGRDGVVKRVPRTPAPL